MRKHEIIYLESLNIVSKLQNDIKDKNRTISSNINEIEVLKFEIARLNKALDIQNKEILILKNDKTKLTCDINSIKTSWMK